MEVVLLKKTGYPDYSLKLISLKKTYETVSQTYIF